MFLQVDEDFVPQDYRLQYRKSSASQFEDVYVGSETEFMVLHIDPNVDYQFRVCARGDGRQEWSPWSVPQSGRTSLVPHGTASPSCWGVCACMELLGVSVPAWSLCAGGVPAFGEDVTCNSFLVSLAEGRSENLSQVLTASLALEST